VSILINNKVRKEALMFYDRVQPLSGTKKEFIKNFEIAYSIAMSHWGKETYDMRCCGNCGKWCNNRDQKGAGFCPEWVTDKLNREERFKE